MKITELIESTTPVNKAGVIPFIVQDDGTTLMMFMTPSDPKYGGPRPQIAKGGIDAGENAQEAAIREGEEELGLNRSNIVTVHAVPPVSVTRLEASYSMAIFAVQVKDQESFGTPHFETGGVHWLTLEQFAQRGRKNQQPLVASAAKIIDQNT